MTYDPRKTVDHPGTDPDKGMKTRPYLKLLLVALIALLVIALVIARVGSKSGPPVKPATTSSDKPNPAPQ